ncbi:MAG: DUF4954 family protein [Chitinophagaceae bacterium]|nr:DUF4954 family protein [Chitinophagaceae bacterium]
MFINFIKTFYNKVSDLRNLQNRSGITYRKLTPGEIKILAANANSSDDWNKILVSDAFNPQLVKNCAFFGLIRIGKLEPWFAEFNNLRMPVGLYNSTIISCDIGDNVVIDNVNFMSHYITGNDVILVNINELATTDHSKFGNGVLKKGEKESVRIWMEICNENAGRRILPFNGMLTGDAWLWSKYRDDEKLLQKFKEFTDKRFDTKRGYYGKIGDRTVIKNCGIIKDVWIGSDAYIKGANKLKNLTINSAPGAKSQIGSNHNSRAADGEIIAGRGFWPGLCVSLKHNSKFASYTLIAKGDFPAELNIPIPFSLVSNEVSSDKLTVMPGYWFMYNMYALSRNAGKYVSRDNRVDKSQELEFDFLAPDSINEIFDALRILKLCTAKAFARKNQKVIAEKDLIPNGETLLENNNPETALLEILVDGFENSQRKVQLVKVPEAYILYKELIRYYGVTQLIAFIGQRYISSWQKLLKSLPKKPVRNNWKNIGGQLVPETSVSTLIRNIRSGKINSWDEIHEFYNRKSHVYAAEKFQHAFASLLEVLKLSPRKFTRKIFYSLLEQTVITKEWMVKNIYQSRAKDYENPFRKMVYDNQPEMDKVMGSLADNDFIKQQQEELAAFRSQVTHILNTFS